ncbi:MAG: hypothetical protein R8K20_01040, partial [Gallionellaceae bacterium]
QAIVAKDVVAARTLWQQAGEKYSLALRIQPDMHEVAYNWGNALAAEAQAVVAKDVVAARALWQQAGEKYSLVLRGNPDNHAAVNNWGNALLTEASAIAASEPEMSQQLFQQAERLLLEHAEAAPGEMAYNLACVYGLRTDVQSCLKWLQVCQQHKTLPDCAHLRAEKDLDLVRDAPEYVDWLKQVYP